MNRLRRSVADRICRGERGFTTAEMLVVVAMTALVAASLVAILTSTIGAERRIDARVTASAELDRVFAAVTADIRAGTPTAPLLSRPGAEMIAVAIDGDRDGSIVHWTIADGVLRRTVVDGASRRVTLDRVFAQGIVTVPGRAFTAYDDRNVEIDDTSAATVDGAGCVTRFRIELAVGAGEDIRTDAVDVAVRLRDEGAARC